MKTAFTLSIALITTFALSSPATALAENGCSGKEGLNGQFTKTITSSGMERTFILNVGGDYHPSEGSPLVFNFHGLGSSPESQMDSSQMADKGVDAGFITVHPQGYEDSWNAGSCCGKAALQDIDDVQFVRDMLEAISEEYCVDFERVHVTGFSNGGYMSHRLACEASDIIASVAPVAGLMGVDCDPERPVPVHQAHGTVDPWVWYNSGVETMDEWASINGCDAESSSYYARGNVDCVRYDNCEGGADVELCTLSGVTHRWVDSRFYDTTGEALDFFTAHPMSQ